MDIGRSLTFFTEEERWIEKTAIGTGVLLISTLLSFILVGFVGFFIAMGYSVRLMQNVQNGVKPVLPEWNQWGDDLSRGFKLFVIQLIWALPIIVVSIPVTIGSAIADSGGSGDFFGVMLVLCGSCLMALYGIFIAIIQPGFTIAFSYDERIGAGLQLSQIWRWTRKNLSDVLIVAVIYLLASVGLGLAGSIVGVLLCGIGLLVTIPLSQLVIYYVQYHLYGQLDPGELVPGGGSYDDFDDGPFGNTAGNMAGNTADYTSADSDSGDSDSGDSDSGVAEQESAPASPTSWTPTMPVDMPSVKPQTPAMPDVAEDAEPDAGTDTGADEEGEDESPASGEVVDEVTTEADSAADAESDATESDGEEKSDKS